MGWVPGGADVQKQEIARQRYDKALAALQARTTAAQNKGEGSVSNFERVLYGAQYPDLQALDPAEQIKHLEQMQLQTHGTIRAGNVSGIGQAPVVQQQLNRPSAFGASAPPQSSPSPKPSATPIKVTTEAQYKALPSGQDFIAPDGSIRTKP